MAATNWIGNAVATKDVWQITVANTWATSDQAVITIAGKDLVITIGSLVTTAQVATSIKEAWESATLTDTTATVLPQGGGTSIPEMSLLTATVSGSVVTLTADTAGVPHTISVSETTAGSGTLSISNTTVATGPNFWSNADNWSGGSVPVSTDDVTIDRPVSILYGLAQSAVTLTSLTITERFTSAAQIGLLRRNANGYEEYRATELAISATTINCRGSSSLIKLNLGTAQTTCNVYSTGTTAETGRPAFQVRGTHASNTFNIFGGHVGVGSNNETANAATIRQESGTVEVGTGVVLTTYTKIAGTASVNCAATTITNSSGTLTHTAGNVTTVNTGGTFVESGSGTITNLLMTGGTATTGSNSAVTTLSKIGGAAVTYGTVGTIVNEGGTTTVHAGNVTTYSVVHGAGYYYGTGTITALNISNGSTVYFDGATAACTVTDTTITSGGKIVDVANRITFTNPIAWDGTLTVS